MSCEERKHGKPVGGGRGEEMKRLLIAFLLLLAAAPAFSFLTTSSVNAVGAPTENYTIPNLPTDDPSHEEKKPAVNFYLKGSSSHSSTGPAVFSTTFTGPLQQNKFTVVGDGRWYLDVDISTPGWLYIYEYYPPNSNPGGVWLAYKWQLKQSGVWEIGPFSAFTDEPEGKHVYRLWFYGNGQWASTDIDDSNSLIYWDYLKEFPELAIMSFSASSRQIYRGEGVTLSWNVQGAQSMEISMIGPVTEASGTITVNPDSDTDYVLIATGLDGSQVSSSVVKVTVSEPEATSPTTSTPSTITEPGGKPPLLDQLLAPTTLISVLSVIVIIILGLLLRMVYIKRWSSPAEVEEPSLAPPQEESLPRENSVAVAILESPGTARAKLSMPQGFEIAITSSSTTIGRTDMARVLGLDELCRISRKQFQVRSTDRQYFIEDMGSANSTSLNGEDIKGKGAVSLKDGDVVEAAGVIKLKFKIMEA